MILIVLTEAAAVKIMLWLVDCAGGQIGEVACARRSSRYQ